MSAPDQPWGVYVHVPWCIRRCPYCAFYVEVDRGEDQRPYVAALQSELELRRVDFESLGPPSTVFFGGGTPSRLDPQLLARLVQAIRPRPGAEISLEANPEDLSVERLQDLRQAGINRLSVGLQTFHQNFARILNRASTVARAREAIKAVQDAKFSSYSVDLMFALPGQSLGDLEVDLDAIEELRPPHVSLYGLTYEPGTPFERARARGRFVEASEELWRAMYDRIAERLRAMGLRRYEISNYALPGHESQHNQLYWRDHPYLGLGPSAHSYAPDRQRWHNVADLSRYLTVDDPIAERERPSLLQATTDRLISGLRGFEGIELRAIERWGVTLARSEIARLRSAGLLASDPDRLILTDSGVPVADAIAAHLASAVSIDAPTR
ncbi:MAG: radical SAM family heme chaperone HemW [Deltaproteobacteria bacterium]|nr:MAG: radical SAM family heme chaperone HemW [Deltaproteobacteria bacterium]